MFINHLKLLAKYNIKSRELYDAMSKFEYSPTKLTKDEIATRQKVLQFVKNVLDEKKTEIVSQTKGDFVTVENKKATLELINRTLDLYLLELNPTVCAVCETPAVCAVCATPAVCATCIDPPSTTGYIAGITVLAIIVVLLLVKQTLLGKV